MKKEAEKKLLEMVKKVVDLEIYGHKYRGGPPYCPAIFHQPKRPDENVKQNM